ncbi:MAG: alpha/beta hydrolase [Rhodobacteraceae bacterium]|nr:alpha/beta hydrolase [Paracoccaceae bacterium]
MSYVAARKNGEIGAPLVFTFHGTGGSEDQFHGFVQGLLPEASVVSPRGDVSEMGSNRYFKRTGEGVYDMDDLARRTEAMAAFLKSEIERLRPSRVMGLGYSNGANILIAVALKYPDIFDDMVVMHPLIPWTPEPQPGLKGRRILMTLGQNDPICPMPLNHALLAYLEQQGAEVETVVHPGGHDIRPEEVDGITAFMAPQ